MKYELGNKESGPGCCAPSPCCKEDEEKVYYPSLYISGSRKLDLPDEGTAVITFRKVSSGEDSRDGKTHYRCELEVHSIEPKGVKKEDGMVNVGEVLKDGMRKKLKKGEYEEGE